MANGNEYLSLRSTKAVLSLQVFVEREDKERIRYQNEPRHMLLEPTTESVEVCRVIFLFITLD